MNGRVLAEYAVFNLVWLACALGAAFGSNVPGCVAAVVFALAQVALNPSRRARIKAIVASMVIGIGAESLLAAAGLFQYAAAWPSVSAAPVWIVSLWLAFGATLPSTARLLKPNPLGKAALIGGLLGPVPYLAGARLGALVASPPLWPAYLSTSLLWAIALPLLIALWLRFEAAGPEYGRARNLPRESNLT